MRAVTLFIFFALLTISSVLANVQAAPELPSSLFHASDTMIESLERLHERAESQIVENDIEGAIRTYRDIMLLEPDDETAYAGMGNCYLLLGQYRNAFDAYQYALSINPQNESAILGTQKIMDPDGVEGMVHPLQIDAEGAVSFTETVTAPKTKETRKALPLPVKSSLVPVARERSKFSDPPLAQPRKLRRLEPEKAQPLPRLPKIKTPVAAPTALLLSDIVDAREIQRAMRNTGFYSGPIDGLLGPVSRNAIKEYQILHELKPDGVVGPKTWATLRLYLDSKR